jgi:hypothetical protein
MEKLKNLSTTNKVVLGLGVLVIGYYLWNQYENKAVAKGTFNSSKSSNI